MRQRLNVIAALSGDDFTPEVREELDGLEVEYGDLERRHRASIMAEGEAEAAAVGLFPDGTADNDGAELRALIGRVTLGDYLGPAAAGSGLRGAAAELAEALEVPAAGPSRWCCRSRGEFCCRAEVWRPGRSRLRAKMTGRRRSGRSCSGCSGRVSWRPWGCVSTRYRWGGRSGP